MSVAEVMLRLYHQVANEGFKPEVTHEYVLSAQADKVLIAQMAPDIVHLRSDVPRRFNGVRWRVDESAPPEYVVLVPRRGDI